jgi:hypothetical protein
VSRWQPQDLISGASDIAAYKFAQNESWRFFINPNMHYKIYLLDSKLLFLGSANLTQKGLHLGMPGNDEASIQLTPTSIDVKRLTKYVDECCLVDEDLYLEISKTINKFKNDFNTEIGRMVWPAKIQNRIQRPPKHLWVNDLLFCSPFKFHIHSEQSIKHDARLLGISNLVLDCNKANLLDSIHTLVVWRWLIDVIARSNNEFVRFGELTAELHNALLDDPKPYRKDVKNLLSNLFDWVRFLDPTELGFKKFKVTEALFLRNS